MTTFSVSNQPVEELVISGATSERGPNRDQIIAISDNDIAELISKFKENTKITKVKLDSIALSETGWSHVAELLRRDHVRQLVLNNTEITAPVATILTQALDHRIYKLVIENGSLSLDATRIIAAYLEEGAKVLSLSLANNDIKADGLIAIAKALQSKKTKLKVLDLSNNIQLLTHADGNLRRDASLYPIVDESGVEAIFNALLRNKTLEVLSLSGMRVERILVMASRLVETNNILRSLDLSSNTIDRYRVSPHRITAFAIALTVNKTLEAVGLAENSIDTDDLVTLSEYMGGFSIKRLSLRLNNYAGSKGANDPGLLALANGIARNRSLVVLDLSQMNIEYTSFSENGNFPPIRESVLQHPNLRVLILNDNKIFGRLAAEMLLDPRCKLEQFSCRQSLYESFGSFIGAIAANPQMLRLDTLSVNTRSIIGETLRQTWRTAIAEVNKHRKLELSGFYAFLMACNRKSKYSVKEEHSTNVSGAEPKSQPWQSWPRLPAEINEKIAGYACYRKAIRIS